MPGFDGTDILHQRLAQAQSTVRTILDGGKPLLDPLRTQDRCLLSVLDHMGAADDLDSPPEFYYLTPADAAPGQQQRKLKINTRVHPLNVDLIAEESRILDQLAAEGIANAQVLGANFVREDRADNFILSSRGALPAFREALDILDTALQAGHNPAAPKTLTIDNSTGRWTPLLALMDLDTDAKRHAFNNYFINGKQAFHLSVVGDPAKIGAELGAYGIDPARATAPAKTFFTPGKQPNIAFETSNEVKFNDAFVNVKKNRHDIHFTNSNSVGGHSETALEFTGSYGGNALDKAVSTLAYKAAQPRDVLESDLAAQGQTLDNTWLLVCDGGGAINPLVFAQPEFDGVRDIVPAGIPAPGPEMKPVILRMGSTADFYGTVNKVIGRMNGGESLSEVRDTFVWLLAPLKQADPKNPVYYAIKASQTNKIGEPRPANAIHKMDKHYMRPPGHDKTLAELEAEKDPYLWKDMTFSLALNALLKKSGGTQRPPDLRTQFNQSAHDFRVLINHQMAPGISDPQIAALAAELKQEGISLVENVRPPQTLSDVRDLVYRSDGYIILPGTKKFDFLLNGLLQTSLLTGKQLRDPHLDDKRIEYLRPSGPDRSTVTQILDHAKETGMITNYYDAFFKQRTNTADIVASFRKSALHYTPHQAAPQRPRVALPDSGRENVTFFFSAGTAIPEFLDDAYQASHCFARAGFGILSGMGRSSMMGLNVYAALELKAQGHDVYVAGVQDPYAMITEGWPKEYVDALMGPDHAQVANDIFERIEVLGEFEKLRGTGRQKILVFQGGGIGTMQELFASLWLIQNTPGLENFHVILQNRPRLLTDGSVKGPYDEFLHAMTASGMKTPANFHVCQTVPEIMGIASAIKGRPLPYYNVKNGAGCYPFEKEKNDQLAKLRPKPYSGPDVSPSPSP